MLEFSDPEGENYVFSRRRLNPLEDRIGPQMPHKRKTNLFLLHYSLALPPVRAQRPQMMTQRTVRREEAALVTQPGETGARVTRIPRAQGAEKLGEDQ